jgi:hypothetical protein
MDPIRWEAFLLFKSLFCKYRLQRTRIQSKFVKPVAILGGERELAQAARQRL